MDHSNQTSLTTAILSGDEKRLDSVAFGNFSSKEFVKHGIDPSLFVQDIMQNQPLLVATVDSLFGRVGIISLPILHENIYLEPKINSILLRAIELSIICGAECCSLTGLIASATNYGKDIVLTNDDLNFSVSTGHGATIAAMVMTIENIFSITKRDIEKETVSFIGLGSVGLSTLKLFLSTLNAPKKLILCEVYSNIKNTENHVSALVKELNYKGEIIIEESVAEELPEVIYEESLFFIGATNIPNIANTDRIRPGTIIIDDSAPHIFDPISCVSRAQKENDILAVHGGKLASPYINQINYYDVMELLKKGKSLEKLSYIESSEIMGCILGSILPLMSDKTPPTLGQATLDVCLSYYNFLKENKFHAAPLQCEGYVYPEEVISKFTNKYSLL